MQKENDIKSLFTKTKTKMKFLLYNLDNPLLVMSVDSNYNTQLTTTEALAMEFNSASDAGAMINLLNPSGAEFWGSRPKRPK